ncbi:hypothetical protein Hanom_Chr06g00486011 [Helianthus anomalus]
MPFLSLRFGQFSDFHPKVCYSASGSKWQFRGRKWCFTRDLIYVVIDYNYLSYVVSMASFVNNGQRGIG